MLEYKVLMGMDYEIVSLTNDEYKHICDYGKCKTEKIIMIKTKNGLIPNSDIDDIELLN